MNPVSANPFNWRTAWLCLAGIAVFYAVSLAIRVARHEGNITSLFCISHEYPLPAALRDQGCYIYPNWIGYDGQFFLFLSVDPLLRAPELSELFHRPDHAAYRAQRIGLPLLAHVLSAGHAAALPYALVGINFAALLVGCWFFLKILEQFGASPLWVWVYALSPGLMAAEFRVLSEALASCLIIVAMWALWKERWLCAMITLCAAALTRETTLLFSVAVAVWALLQRKPGRAAGFFVPVIVYGLWCAYVRSRLGTGPFSEGAGANLGWPMVGLVEKFWWVLGLMVKNQAAAGIPVAIRLLSVFVEVLLCLGLLFSLYLAVKRLEAAPRDWLTLAWCAYGLLAVTASAVVWSRYWHPVRIFDLLLLLPLLVYLQTKDSKYLVPWLCALPVSLAILLSRQ